MTIEGHTSSAQNGKPFTPSPLYNPTIHITTHNPTGLATLYSSNKGKPDHYPAHNFSATTLYTTSSMPVNLNHNADLSAHEALLASGKLGVVQAHGTVCRFADFGPGSQGFMHRTQSLDYGIILDGEMVLELDDGSATRMQRGDVAVQRGTMHKWVNPSTTEWARILFVLQDCEPILVNGVRFGEDLGAGEGVVPKSGNDS